jgi:4-carboxymuconolactone decarboxylase
MKIVTPVAAALVLASAAAAQQPTSVAPRAMQAIAPSLAEYTDKTLFGDVWRRPELAPRDRSLVTLAVLVSTGKTAQLEGHIGRALDNGVRPSEIAGLVTQLAFYSGWPNAVSSLDVIERVFAKRGVDTTELKADMFASVADSSASDPGDASVGTPTIAPKFAQLTHDTIFGNLWRRTDLALRDRSLVTIAALAANGDDGELKGEIAHGLANGLSREQIVEALTHLAFYAGWPKATSAIAAAAEVLGQSAGTKSEDAAHALQVFVPDQTPKAGPAEYFTGSVTVTSPFHGSAGSRLAGSTVTFQPGARTNWHSHALGQLLIVTSGHGWVQVEGGPVRAVGPGDVIWTPPGVMHWHGATRTSAMTHVAVSEAQGADAVRWGAPVSDAQYQGPE